MHSRIVAVFVLGLLALSFVAVDVAGAAVSSSSSSSTKAAVSSSTSSTTKTTTTETLSPMTTNKVYDTTDTCFQGKGGNNTIQYVFKPSGFMYWQNKAGGNFTITGYSIGQISTSTTTPKSNSTALDYSLSSLGFSAHIFLKNIPSGCTDVPGNTFKFTISGSTTNPTVFTFNFGNPNNQKITCDNANHVITYGVTGINFTDSMAFGATCTNTTLSFNISIGQFKIDPVTVVTSTNSPVFDFDYDAGNTWVANGRYWIFYTGNVANSWVTSTDGITWSSPTTFGAGYKGYGISLWIDSSNNVCYIGTLTQNKNFRTRCGTANSDGTITWSFVERTITTTNNVEFTHSIAEDTSGNLYASMSAGLTGTRNVQVARCAGGSSNWGTCTWTLILNQTTGINAISDTALRPLSGGNLTIAYNQDATNAALKFINCASPCSSSANWGSVVTSSQTNFNIEKSGFVSVGGTMYMALWQNTATPSVQFTTFSYNSASCCTLTQLVAVSGLNNANIGTDASNRLTVAYSTGSVVSYLLSPNLGSTWGSGTTLAGSETSIVAAQLHVSPSADTQGNYGVTWAAGSSPINIRFAVLTIPSLVQEKTCTYTAASSPTCQFTSSITSGNIVYVIPSDSVAADTVSSVTDSGSNTYYFITRQNSLSAVGNVEGWYSITTTGGTLTVTVNLGISLSGAIIINEVGGARNDGPLSSIGTGTGTATSVTSYSPDANSLVIGGINSGCLTLCTVTAGTSYTLDDNAAVSTLFQASSEHITNTGTAETTPFALSASSGWNEISVAFAPPSSPVAETATLSQTVSVTPALSRVFAGVRSLNPAVALSAVVNVICPQLDCIQRSISGNGSIMPWVAAIIVLLFISASLGVLAVKRGTEK